MAETQQRTFHSVVFSVSGFPGEFVTEEVAREQVSLEREEAAASAGVGGHEAGLFLILGRPTLPSEVGMIVCAVTNPASLDEMAAQAAVILNCVRPVSNQHFFVLEQGICSCLAECGSSCSRELCVPICGRFLRMFHEHMRRMCILIFFGCSVLKISIKSNFSILLGFIFNNYPLRHVTLTLELFHQGLCIHDGTWKSAAYDFADKSQLKKLRNESHLKPVPVVGPKLKRRWPVSYCRELNSYSIPFLGADVSVVKRTQCYLHENLEQSPVNKVLNALQQDLLVNLEYLFHVIQQSKFSAGNRGVVSTRSSY
uniref:Uncharacterized protein n=1 Tax=Sus scrofa TaxID=9823 RepID=F1S650_PIG